MTQSLTFGGFIKAAGIIPVLFTMGFILCRSEEVYWLGVIALCVSVGVGSGYAILGFVGILQKMNVVNIKPTTASLGGLLRLLRIKR